MIKILLVDDEVFIRQGIRHTIPWEEHGMEIVGEAANGEEGLRMAIQLTPDIVLTDIQMPVMNGIELARNLNTFLPRTKVIILSAYGSTENFTSAIEVKVSSFVLKNADSGKILESVLRAKESLLEESTARGQDAVIQNIYKENQQLIKSDVFAKFLNHELPIEVFRKKAEKLELDLPGPAYSLLLAECTTRDQWVLYQLFAQSFPGCQPFVFFTKPAKLVVLLNLPAQGLTKDTLDKAIPCLKPHILGNSLAVIPEIVSLEELPDAYDVLEGAMDTCFWSPDHEYISVKLSGSFADRAAGDILPQESKVIAAVLSRQPQQMEAAIIHYFDFMRQHAVSRSRFLESVGRIVVLMEAVMDRAAESHKLTELIAETETPEEILELMLSLVKPVNDTESRNVHFAAALEYINRHYDQDLKLADVAKAAYLSTGYLSRIFKNETGYSFKEWLNRVRIDKAKELILSSDLKYYEIAERVGYKDYKYFSAYFSKLCGLSAKEYKMQNLPVAKG